MYVGFLCGFNYLLVRCVKIAVGNVFAYGAVEKKNVLLNYAYVAAQGIARHVAYVHAVYGYRAGVYFIESRYKVAKRGLSAAGGTYQRNGLALVYTHGKVRYHLGFGIGGVAV